MKKWYTWRRPLAVLLLLILAIFAFFSCYRLTVTIDGDAAQSRFGLGIILSLMNPQNLMIEENPQTKPFSLVEGLVNELSIQGQSLTGMAVVAGLAAVLTVAGIILFCMLFIRSLLGRFSRSFEVLAFILLGVTALSGGLFWLSGQWLSAMLSSPHLDMSYIGQATVRILPDFGWFILLICQLLLAVGLLLLRLGIGKPNGTK